MKTMLFVNLLIKCAFLAAMCFCIRTNHLVMGGWCLVGAILGGYTFKDEEKEANDANA